MKKKINFKCPYNDFSCTELDTSTMTCIECSKCKHYNNGVRPTGATPVLAWFINLFKKQRYE